MTLDSDSNGWPDCCYWNRFWEITCSILLTVYLLFLGFNMYCLWRLRGTEGKFHCKKFFHQSSGILTSVRAIQLLFLILGNAVWPHTPGVYYFSQLLTFIGGNLFALVYSAVIAFWVTFYVQTKFGDYFSTTKYNHRLQTYITATEIFFLVIVILESFFMVYTKAIVKHSFMFVVVTFLFFNALLLLLEGIAFFIIGFLLYYSLRDPTNPLHFQMTLSSRALQIVVFALFLFVVMFTRAILNTIEVFSITQGFQGDFHQPYDKRPSSPEDSDQMFMGEDFSWWFYLLYYFWGECFPLGLMTLFQSRLPKSKNSVIHWSSQIEPTDETIQLRPTADGNDSYDED
mmetsp:Transcript_28783/g.39837  ORF Transcript_28783/g.39837 Transcript_28783/m.39837 type:complete len:343 (+) Transcript_28783:26-1054(+)